MDVLECDDDASEYENFDSDPDPRFCAIFCFFLVKCVGPKPNGVIGSHYNISA